MFKFFLHIINQILSFCLIFFVKIYKKCISPFFPRRCNFIPSCSQYMIDAINEYGAFKGLYLGIKRIFKCNPLNKNIVYDPVKTTKNK